MSSYDAMALAVIKPQNHHRLADSFLQCGVIALCNCV